jgi:Xaa-Pro aminopeptidase
MTQAMAMDRIPEAQLAARLVAVRDIMANEGVERLVIYGPPRRLGSGGAALYLAGWTSPGAATVMVIGTSGRPVIFGAGPNVSRVFRQRTANFADTRTVMGGPSVLAEAVAEALAALPEKGDRLGVVGAAMMPLALREAVAAATPATIALDGPVDALRLVRTAEEVVLHARAAAISDAMVGRAMELGRAPETAPADIMTGVEYEGRRRGADFAGLWLATGERPPTTYFELFELNPEIGPHDRVQLGTTLTYEGHYAQTLRVGVRGRPSQALRDCAQRLVDMQEQVLSLMRPGVPMHRIDDTLEALIDADCPYERQADPFRFQSCHALGLDYAEPAYATALSPERDRRHDAAGPLLVENMVFEIHPNYTLPELGHVCAGDMAVVTATGARWLTSAPRGLTLLD